MQPYLLTAALRYFVIVIAQLNFEYFIIELPKSLPVKYVNSYRTLVVSMNISNWYNSHIALQSLSISLISHVLLISFFTN